MAETHLPIAGFDELPLTTLQHRIRSLTEEQLQQLLEHEHAHADRVQVVELLHNRQTELEQGAVPTQGEHEPYDVPQHSPAGSPVQPQAPPERGQKGAHGTRSSTGKGAEHNQ